MPLIQYSYPYHVQDLVQKATEKGLSHDILSQWREVLAHLSPDQIADVYDEVEKDPSILDYLIKNVTQKITLVQDPNPDKIQQLLDDEQKWCS